MSIASKSQSDLVFQDRGGGLRDEKGPPKGSLTPGVPIARLRVWTCYGHAKACTWPHFATFLAILPSVGFTQVKQHKMLINSKLCYKEGAEREGFEPPEPCGSADFKSAAIDHSATSP